MSLIRADLAVLPSYSAGGLQPGRIRLASNESPFDALAAVQRTLSGGGVEVYPDILSTTLRGSLAARLGVTPEEVAVGCGSSALCYDLARLSCSPGSSVVGPWRSFEAYPILAGVASSNWHPVALVDDRLDLETMAATSASLVFLCNPNNPTGTAFSTADLSTFLDSVHEDTLVVVDEAYIEFAGTFVADAVALYRQQRPKNLAVLRTFSKAYGLAGLRVGYCVSHPDVIAALHQVQVPFAVNSVAQAAALAALSEAEEVQRRCAEICKRREAMSTRLRRLGYEIPESQANFLWLRLDDDTGLVADHLADEGIATRAYAGEGIRVTVGTEDACAAFLDTMSAL
ncbi:histidinol-phosphate transaminase [Nocardia goodfellowii]